MGFIVTRIQRLTLDTGGAAKPVKASEDAVKREKIARRAALEFKVTGIWVCGNVMLKIE